jgi:HAMP domain-containing protein
MHFRRLIGPTILSLALCGLLADYLFLGGSSWSVFRFLRAVVSVLAGVLTPPYGEAAYTWIQALWFPLSIGIFATLLLRTIVAGAKKAMGQATFPVSHPPDDFSPVSTGATSILEQQPSTNSGSLSGFSFRLSSVLVAVALIFGSMTCLIVYKSLASALQQHAQDRVSIMAFGLSELVVRELHSGGHHELNAAVASYAAREKIAYSYVENGEGEIIAHWPAELPRYLRRDFPHSSARALAGTTVDYRGRSLYAVAQRIEEGRRGFVHVAVEQGNVQDATREVVVNLALTITPLVFLCGATFFVWAAGAIQRPWSEIVDHASRMSRGDFTRALPLDRDDEFGDIARSLERLRSSLHATVKRLA